MMGKFCFCCRATIARNSSPGRRQQRQLVFVGFVVLGATKTSTLRCGRPQTGRWSKQTGISNLNSSFNRTRLQSGVAQLKRTASRCFLAGRNCRIIVSHRRISQSGTFHPQTIPRSSIFESLHPANLTNAVPTEVGSSTTETLLAKKPVRKS
jgi:hypothetical protein